MFTATKDAANEVKNEAKANVYHAKRQVREAASDIRADLEDVANQAGRKMRHYLDTASDQLGHATDKVTREIRTNPIRSSLVALGSGFLLGLLLRR